MRYDYFCDWDGGFVPTAGCYKCVHKKGLALRFPFKGKTCNKCVVYHLLTGVAKCFKFNPEYES